jgi:hypothetical protein
LPRSLEFYHFRRSGEIYPYCRECERARRKRYYEENKEAEAESARTYYQDNSEKLKAYTREYNRTHPEKVRNQRLEYYHKTRETSRNKWKAKYYSDVEKSRENSRAQYAQRKDQAREYRVAHRERYRVHRQNRRALEKSLPNNFKPSDWQYALEYFGGCCAVCGRQLRDLFGSHTAAADHWIPLSSPTCPGTTRKNILPLCHGVSGCNNSKNDSDPGKWLRERYGKRRAREILKRIQAYFDSLE